MWQVSNLNRYINPDHHLVWQVSNLNHYINPDHNLMCQVSIIILILITILFAKYINFNNPVTSFAMYPSYNNPAGDCVYQVPL